MNSRNWSQNGQFLEFISIPFVNIRTMINLYKKFQPLFFRIIYSEVSSWIHCWWIFLIWWSRLSFRLNFLSHRLHLNGFSPVWVRMWYCMCCFVPDLFEQNGHLKSLWPMWIGSFCQLKRKKWTLTNLFLKCSNIYSTINSWIHFLMNMF